MALLDANEDSNMTLREGRAKLNLKSETLKLEDKGKTLLVRQQECAVVEKFPKMKELEFIHKTWE